MNLNDNVNLLEKCNYHRNKSNSYYNQLEDLIFDFEEEYDVSEDYLIELNSDAYIGVISVVTSKVLVEWFRLYHDAFISFLDLKLIRINRSEYLGHGCVRFRLEYTYNGNVRFDELDYHKLSL